MANKILKRGVCVSPCTEDMNPAKKSVCGKVPFAVWRTVTDLVKDSDSSVGAFVAAAVSEKLDRLGKSVPREAGPLSGIKQEDQKWVLGLLEFVGRKSEDRELIDMARRMAEALVNYGKKVP